MKPNLLSAPSRLSRLNGLWCTGRRWSLLHLRTLRFVRRRSSVSIRFPAVIVEKLEGGEAAVKRQHHLASFDLADLPSIELVADLRAYQFLLPAGTKDAAGALAIYHHTEDNQVGRWGRRSRRRRRLHDRRRRRRKRTTPRRKQRAIE